MIGKIRKVAGDMLPRVECFHGELGDAWFASCGGDTMGMASAFCGSDTAVSSSKRIRRGGLIAAAQSAGEAGAFALACGLDPEENGSILAHSVEMPLLIRHPVHLPESVDDLRKQLWGHSVKDDLRLIRRANFVPRVETDERILQKFYEKYYKPYMTLRYGHDSVESVETLVGALDKGGELLCLDIDGEWVAGMLNVRIDDTYAFRLMGVRDGDADLIKLRPIPALFVFSMERAITQGIKTVWLGTTIPLLGEGNARFKAKWGSTIDRSPFARATGQLFLDLRHECVRSFLSREPVVTCVGDSLRAVRWLEPGAAPLKRVCRDVDRFRGIERWYVMGTPDVIDEGMAAMTEQRSIFPVTVEPSSEVPCWIGELIAD